ncbi:unnamed protein product [Prunus armeniaca]
MEGRVDNYNDMEEIRRMLRQLTERVARIEARTQIGKSSDGERCMNPYLNRVARIDTLSRGSLDGEYEGDSPFHYCASLCESSEEGHGYSHCVFEGLLSKPINGSFYKRLCICCPSPLSSILSESLPPTALRTVSLKLLIDTESNKVLFAEASKEVVDFLDTLLSLNFGTVTRLLISNGGMVGCLGKLYESLENLSDTYMQPNLNKDSLLKKTTTSGANILQLPANNDSNAPKRFYLCVNCKRHISDSTYFVCAFDSYGFKLVKASLESKTALTNVFLGNKVHEGFSFGPLKKLSFWRFILVCGLTLTVLAYIGLFQLWPSDLIGKRYGKNDPTSPRKPICYPNLPFALSLIQK